MVTGRPVTLVVSDLKGSTALAEHLDSETLRAVLGRYFDEMGIIFESHGGVIAKIIGDALVALFGDDDPARAARRAARAAVEAQTALTWLNDRFEATWGVQLHNRTGVASGALPRVSLDDATGGDVLAGEVLATAEALEAAAPTMEALIDEQTRTLIAERATVEQVGPVPSKTGQGTIAAWRLVAVKAPAVDAGTVKGAVEARMCQICGSANDRDAHWCTSCRSALATGDLVRESRRTVTILFADPQPATTDATAMTAETTQAVMARYYTVMRPILERHGGTVERFIGDAVMAVFGLPARHEDDALRALRAADDMQVALVGLNTELSDRFGVTLTQPIGVNTGTVVAGDADEGQRLVTGDAVNVAARFEQAAGPDDVILGATTRRLVGDAAATERLPPLPLKGKTRPVAAYRLVRIARRMDGRAHALPLVGREDELSTLRRILRTTVREQQARRVTVIGEAGVGKSRLTYEFVTEAGMTATILRGRCLAYGDGITFWGLLEMVHEAAGVTEDDDADTARRRVGALVGDNTDVLARVESIIGLTDTSFAVGELVWAMRWLVERLSEVGPVVLVFDDIHWAEPTFIEVIQRLTATVRGPVLLLCTARPIVLQEHREFVAGALSVVLEPLTDEQCERFMLLVLDDAALDADVVHTVANAAGGNPLFLDQFLSMLIEEDRVRHVNGRWRAVGDLSTLEVPATIEAVLATRLDRLPDQDKPVLGSSSVIGREFPQDAVVAIVERDLRPQVPTSLDRLTERELLEVADDPVPTFRFQHQLIRDATYHSMLKESRAILHERFARYLDARQETRDRSIEVQEIHGYHLEQAYHYWSELGLVDRRIVELGIGAARRLGAAGERALARGDMPAAASLLLRAADLLPDDHRAKPRQLLLAGSALDEAGWFDQAIDAFDSSARAARVTGSVAAVEAATIARSRLEYLTGRGAEGEHIGRDIERTLDRVTALADPDALSRAWQLRLDVDIAACRWAAAQHAANQVIAHARRAGNAILEQSTMRLLAFLAQKGPMPVAEAMAVCRDIIERVASDRRSAAVATLDLAMLTAMTMDFDTAGHLCVDARATLGELGADTQAALVSLSAGPIELLAGEPQRAEVQLRRDFDALRRMGERNFVALVAALLGEAVYRQQRFAEADELVAFAREVAAPDDVAVRIVAGCVEGKLIARAGDTATGLALVREAVHLIETTEDPSGQADAWLDLTETLYVAGEREGAVQASGQARVRYVQKGNRAGVRRADTVLRRLNAGEDPWGGRGPPSAGMAGGVRPAGS